MPVKAPKTARHLEVECKFDVVESTVSPSFEGIAAVARVERKPVQALDAVYFDTADQDLASNRITLRRRTGGSDAGWHLKLPAGGDARTELHAPITEPDTSGSLGAPTQHRVPAELLDVVLAIVRDRPLQPVARINTQRASQFLYGVDGAPLAEFCDDHVTAWSAGAGPDAEPAQQQWREWELELSDPSQSASRELLDRLSNRLLDTGAAPAGHDSKLARVLGSTSPWAGRPEPADPVHRAVARYVAELLVWDRAVRTDVDDSVHQMRVTTRKIRSLLADSQDSFGLADKAWVLDELRELAAVLGVARDAEVLGQRYQHALERLDPTLVRGPVYERLVDGARHRYHAGLRRSLVAMRSKRYFRLLDALDAIAAAYPADTAAAGLSRPHPRVSRRPTDGSARPPNSPRRPPRRQVRRPSLPPWTRVPTSAPTRRCTESASAPRGCATPPRPPEPSRSPARPRPSRRCSAITRTAWSAESTCSTRPMRRTPRARTPLPTVCCISGRAIWPRVAGSGSTPPCTGSTSRYARPDAERGWASQTPSHAQHSGLRRTKRRPVVRAGPTRWSSGGHSWPRHGEAAGCGTATDQRQLARGCRRVGRQSRRLDHVGGGCPAGAGAAGTDGHRDRRSRAARWGLRRCGTESCGTGSESAASTTATITATAQHHPPKPEPPPAQPPCSRRPILMSLAHGGRPRSCAIIQ